MNTQPPPQQWQIDPVAGTALHLTGMLLRAARQGDRFQVQPDPSTVPAAGPGMSQADIDVLHQEIARRVTEGGQLLVTAMADQQRR